MAQRDAARLLAVVQQQYALHVQEGGERGGGGQSAIWQGRKRWGEWKHLQSVAERLHLAVPS